MGKDSNQNQGKQPGRSSSNQEQIPIRKEAEIKGNRKSDNSGGDTTTTGSTGPRKAE